MAYLPAALCINRCINRSINRCKTPRLLWLAGILVVLVSCSAPVPRTVQTPLELAPYRPFLTPALLLPFRATGAARFLFKGEAQSGDFILMASKEQVIQLQLLAPVTGSLVLELRFDSQRLMLLDFNNHTYFSGANTPENRDRLLGLDMTSGDFLMALTGRLPRDLFASSGGRRISDRHLRMEDGATGYEFWLNADGLPERWEKTREGQRVYRVEYRDYLELATASGAPLLFPRKFRVYTGGEKPVLIMGVREVMPGVAHSRPLGFDPPDSGSSDGAQWRFQPLGSAAP